MTDRGGAGSCHRIEIRRRERELGVRGSARHFDDADTPLGGECLGLAIIIGLLAATACTTPTELVCSGHAIDPSNPNHDTIDTHLLFGYDSHQHILYMQIIRSVHLRPEKPSKHDL